MANLTNSTAYNGMILPPLYEVLEVGNELISKGVVHMIEGIDSNGYLPKISGAANPLAAYATTPSSESATVTYAERTLTVSPMMLYMTFLPKDWIDLWPMFKSVGDLTNLALNPDILAATLRVLGNSMGGQIDKLGWQGDTASGTPALALANGFIKLAGADAAVIDVTNNGVITQSNVIDILEDVYEAIPNKFYDDPMFRIHMSTTAFRYLQQANLDAKKGTTGVLSQNVERLFLEKRIEHFNNLPTSTIIGARTMTTPESNFIMGMWVNPDGEEPRIMRVANNSDEWFIRINMQIGFQYREGSEIVMYQGS